VDDERSGITEDKIVFRSQPHFEMGERTVPIKHLNDEGKDKAREMEDFYNPVLDSPESTQKEKDNPEKMDQNNAIRKNLVEHLSNAPPSRQPIAYHIIPFFPRKRLSKAIRGKHLFSRDNHKKVPSPPETVSQVRPRREMSPST
jgi:hypothetical protein